MYFKKIFLITALIAIILMGISTVSAGDLSDDTISVDSNITLNNQESLLNSADSSINEETDDIEVNNWEELQIYCSLSDKNYNLKLKENTNYYPSNPTDDSFQIIVNNNVTITGSSGAYIGDSASTPRNITYAPIKVNDNSGVGVTLKGVTFKNIAVKYSPDAIFFSMGGNVNNIFSDCRFEYISVTGGHSSILHIRYGDLNIINSTFLNCTTDYGCISVYCPTDRTGDTYTSARMNVEDSYFAGNFARTEPGCINNCGLTIVKNTTFYRNGAFWWAGAIHTHGGGNTTIYDSNFIDNVAGWNGGALYTYSYLQIYNTNFTGNNCTTNNGGGAIGACRYGHSPIIYIEKCVFKENNNNCWGLTELSTSGTGRGGAISIMDAGLIEVKESTFIHNSASMGSAIAVTGGGSYGSPNVILTGNRFINNTKTGDVLYIYVAASSHIDIHDNVFENSTIELSKLRISSGVPQNNTVTITVDAVLKNPTAYDIDILDQFSYDVYVDGSYYKTIKGNKFACLFEDEEKHSIYITSPISGEVSNAISVIKNPKYIYVSQKQGNNANDGSRQNPVKTLSRAIELANTSGNIRILDGTYSEKDLNITYELTITGEDNVVIAGTQKNVFSVNATSFTIKNIKFTNLKTEKSDTIISSNGLVIIEDCQFNGGNYAQGIVANELNIENTIFNGITVYYDLIKTDRLTADNITITNNIYTGNSPTNALLIGSSIKTWNIINSNFSHNSNLKGGVISLTGKSARINLYNLTFDSNSINQKNSPSYTSCIYVASDVNVKIDNSLFINNNNSYYSKAAIIYNVGGYINILNSVLLNNTHGTDSTIFYASTSNLAKITSNNNWFGTSMEQAPDLNSQINYRVWYTLNVTSNVTKLGPGEKALITFDLNNLLSRNGAVSNSRFMNPYEVKLTLSAVNGFFNTNQLTLKDGFGQVEFTKTGEEDAVIEISYLGGSAILELQGGKNNPTLSIEAENITAGDDLTITVHLTSDATGNTVLFLNNISYVLEFEEGVATKTFNNVKAGNYTIFVNYEGNEKYDTVNKTLLVTSTQLESIMTVNINTQYYADEEIIAVVNIPVEATGNITLTIGNKTLVKEANNGEAVFNLTGLPAGEYNILIDYPGSIIYTGISENLPLTISKYETQTIIWANLENLELGDELTVYIQVSQINDDNITINHNGVLKNIELTNGEGTYHIDSLTKGDHIIKAFYTGNWKYGSSEDSISFSIAKLNSTVKASVENINYGENATVIVTPINGATGNVTVKVDNKTYHGEIQGDKAIIYIPGLNAGVKNLTVIYGGDNNYFSSQNITAFTVHKTNSTFKIISNSIMVGETLSINITFDKTMTGTFTLNNEDTKAIVKGINFKVWELKNLEPGSYTFNISYNGDNNYYPSNASTIVTVNEYPTPQVPNANNPKSQFEGLANGKILFTITLKDYIGGGIVIDDEGNIYFASNDKVYAYSKNGESLWNFTTDSIEGALSGVSLGRNILISPHSGNRLLFINITSGNENIHSNMYQGSSLFEPVIDENYTVYITSEYQNFDKDYKLAIIPYGIWRTSIQPEMISIGDSMPISAPVIIDDSHIAIATEKGIKIIDLTTKKVVYSGAEKLNNLVVGHGGSIYALTDDSIVCMINQITQWETKVTGGTGDYLALDNDLGYLYSANSEGILYKYDIATGEEIFIHDFNDEITSNVLIDSEGKIFLGTAKGMFYSLDSEGNVLWKINLNDKIISNPVIDEEGFIYVMTNSSIVKLVKSELEDAEINVNIKNITYGEDLKLDIEFDEITGEISVLINNVLYDASIISNKNNVALTIPNLTAGKYTAIINYTGDKRFKSKSLNIPFMVSKQQTSEDVIISQDSCTVNLPNHAKGNLTVFIDDKFYKTVELVNGSAKIDIPQLDSGNHVIKSEYSGDDNFAPISKTLNVYVPLVKIVGNDLTALYTSDSLYKVRLTSDNIGLSQKTILITINGVKQYAVTDKNGYATVKINLPPKSSKYTVTAEYNGIKATNNIKINSIISAKNVKVKKSAKTLKIKVTLIKVNGKYLKSKKITIKLNGKKFTAKTNKKGVATFKISKKVIKKLKAGKKYKYQIIFQKDTIKKTLTVKK